MQIQSTLSGLALELPWPFAKTAAEPLPLVLALLHPDRAGIRIDAAMTAVLAEKKQVTRDLGGTAGTKGFAEAIIVKL